METMIAIARRARDASYIMQSKSKEERNNGLRSISKQLELQKDKICSANKQDKITAEEQSQDQTLQARLNVEGEKFTGLLKGIETLISSPDLVGRVTLARELMNGLNMYRISCPIGVVCIVFESRPEAAVQISSLAIKSGNCVILKGGKEAALSNQAIVDALREGLKEANLPVDAIQLVNTRAEVSELLKLNQYIDLVVPRGSNQLVTSVMNSTSIPVLGHADGICSIFLDEHANLNTALRVIVDAKCNYPAACNAAETLLVHSNVVNTLLVEIGKELSNNQVKMIADKVCYSKLPKERTELAKEDFEFNVEHLNLTLSVKVVNSLQDAIDHINKYGSHHTDVILTENEENAKIFCQKVDSAGVYHNCSSRFADGFRYGFGAELGVSTNRVHARGPVGMEGLLTYKYVLKGSGQIVGGLKTSEFTHKDLDSSLLNKPLSIFGKDEKDGVKRTKVGNKEEETS